MIIKPIKDPINLIYHQTININKHCFIDVDCLVIDKIDWIFDRFNNHPVSVMGRKVITGSLLGTTVEALKEKVKIDYLPTFNGGVYYFEKGEKAENVFDDAINIFTKRYDELNLWKFSGLPGDEPAMSIAMAMNNIQPIDDSKRGMYTPVGQKGVFKMDALKGICNFFSILIKLTNSF